MGGSDKGASGYGRFARQGKRLGCSDLELTHLGRLVNRFHGQYGWIPLDEMLAEVLTSSGRALRGFRPGRGASRTTYLMTSARNALISLTVRELRQRRRARTLEADEDWSVFQEPVVEDLLPVVSRTLSPLAYQLLSLVVREQPKKRSTKWLSRTLGLSAHTVRALRHEMKTTVPAVLEAARG